MHVFSKGQDTARTYYMLLQEPLPLFEVSPPSLMYSSRSPTTERPTAVLAVVVINGVVYHFIADTRSPGLG